MSASKSERLLNLLIMLLSTRGWVGRDRIRQVIEGYRGLDDRNFERTFERDKAELRSIGVPVEAGSHESEGGEPGYRVDRSAFELPPISFTTDELAALGAAARVWQDSVAADDTRVALATLRAAGADPDAARLLTLQPQLTAIDGLDVWWEALRDRREVRFGYRDEPRRLQPWRIVQRRGHWYVIGLDPTARRDATSSCPGSRPRPGRSGRAPPTNHRRRLSSTSHHRSSVPRPESPCVPGVDTTWCATAGWPLQWPVTRRVSRSTSCR